MTTPNNETGPSPEGLSRVMAELERVDQEYRWHRLHVAELGADRTRLVRESRDAGATFAQIAEVLGVKRASVQSLLRASKSDPQ